MSVLLQINNIDRTTIADGDKLNSIVTGLSTNDDTLLSELSDIYADANACKTFIEENRENWENSAVKNFSGVTVKDVTISGKNWMSSELTLTSDNSCQFIKNDNDTYSINTSLPTDLQAISSYFVEAKLSRNTLLPNEILLLRSRISEKFI